MTTLTSTSCSFGLSDLELVEVKRSYGPQLRFALTWIVDLADGRTLAQSTPGFRYLKNPKGEFRVVPPIKRSDTYATYYTSTVSQDLMDAIEAELVAGGWKKKVGKNNPLGALKNMPGDLSTEIPKGKRHK